jgi:LacI family transcriptional regulator
MQPRQTARATIDQVAARAGVSTATVSRVLNNSATVSAETSRRVFEAVSELNYVPHAAARALASNRTNTLGLMLPNISNEFFSPLLRGVEAGTRAAGYDLLIHSTGDRQSQDVGFRRVFGDHNTDGLLIFANSVDEQYLKWFRQIRLPVVLLLELSPETLDIPSVLFENKDGVHQLIDHFVLVHGCRRIAFLRGPETNQDSQWREKGYRTALESHGLPIDEALIGVGNFEENASYQTMSQWIADGIEIDAVFAADDESAIGAMRAITDAGLNVPGDIRVIGFDDLPISRHLNPPLTTIRAPIAEAGQTGSEMLISLIRTGKAETTLLPVELMIRRSCGCE